MRGMLRSVRTPRNSLNPACAVLVHLGIAIRCFWLVLLADEEMLACMFKLHLD